jgi:cell division protein ZapA (FtsZ GTPase activity inhibitor)
MTLTDSKLTEKGIKLVTTITIDGKDYDLDILTESARSQLESMHLVDQKIAQLQSEIAIAQTARNAYAAALKAELPVENDPE